MASKLERKIKRTVSKHWSDLELGVFISTRTASLLKQVIAYTFAKNSFYQTAQIQQQMEALEISLLVPKQQKIFEILQKLTSPIQNGELASSIDQVVSKVTAEVRQIQKLCWRGNSHLIKAVQEIVWSGENSERNLNPLTVMEALIIALVQEIISLVELDLDKLIVHVQEICPNTFDEDTIQALEGIARLHAQVVCGKAEFQTEERKEYEGYYNTVVGSKFNFELFFPFDPETQAHNYVDMVPTDGALLEILRSYTKLIKSSAAQQAKLSEYNVKVAEGEYEVLKINNDMKLLEKKQEILNASQQDQQSIADLVERMEDLSVEKEKHQQELDELRAEKSSLEIKLRDSSGKVKQLTEDRDHWKKRYEALRLKSFKEETGGFISNARSLIVEIKRERLSEQVLQDRCEMMENNLASIEEHIQDLGEITVGEEALDEDDEDGM